MVVEKMENYLFEAFVLILLVSSIIGCTKTNQQTDTIIAEEQDTNDLTVPLNDIEELETSLDLQELDNLEQDLQNLDW